MENFDNLTRDELIKLLEVYALSWLAHDGCWFLSAEENFSLETAINLDAESWKKFAPIEAKRLMKFLKLGENSGLDGLEKVLKHRMYSVINKQSFQRKDNTLIFKMDECRVQKTRTQKGLPLFPCKPVGTVEFNGIATAVDKRITVKCISCPPDEVSDFYCGWEFKIE